MRNRIRVWAFAIRLCWRSLFKLNLGDEVVYNGEVWILMNGPSDPLWTIHRKSDNKRLEYIHRDNFKKIRSIKNAWHDVIFTWSFYSGYWFQIWYRDPSKMRSYPGPPKSRGSFGLKKALMTTSMKLLFVAQRMMPKEVKSMDVFLGLLSAQKQMLEKCVTPTCCNYKKRTTPTNRF